jgi:hypothetical protein
MNGAAKPGTARQMLEATDGCWWLWLVYILTARVPSYLFSCSGKKQPTAMEYKNINVSQPDVKEEEEEKVEEKGKGDDEEEDEGKLEEKQKSDVKDGGTVSQENLKQKRMKF